MQFNEVMWRDNVAHCYILLINSLINKNYVYDQFSGSSMLEFRNAPSLMFKCNVYSDCVIHYWFKSTVKCHSLNLREQIFNIWSLQRITSNNLDRQRSLNPDYTANTWQREEKRRVRGVEIRRMRIILV